MNLPTQIALIMATSAKPSAVQITPDDSPILVGFAVVVSLITVVLAIGLLVVLAIEIWKSR